MTDVKTPTHGVAVREVAWDDPEAAALRTAMRAEVDPRYPDRPAPPAGMDVDPADLVFAALAEIDGRAVGHVAVRRLGPAFELKRMYVRPEARCRGVGSVLLAAAEHAAVRAGATRMVLQTGDRQPEAVATYERAGYSRIPVFEPYLTLPFSRCYAKDLPAGDDGGAS